MKKPTKFEDITVAPSFMEKEIDYTYSSGHISMSCQYCTEVFTTFLEGASTEEGWVNKAAKHYFKKHWLALKAHVIEPDPPATTLGKGGMISTSWPAPSTYWMTWPSTSTSFKPITYLDADS